MVGFSALKCSNRATGTTWKFRALKTSNLAEGIWALKCSDLEIFRGLDLKTLQSGDRNFMGRGEINIIQKNWSERNVCSMHPRTQWPLLTRVIFSLSSLVYTEFMHVSLH